MDFYLGIGFGLITGGVIVFLILRRRSLPEQVSAGESDNLSLYKSITETLETERERIASGIHDEVIGYITTINLHLQILNYLAQEPQMAEQVRTMEEKIGYIMEALRRIVNDMLPLELESGDLNGAIKNMCYRHNGLKGINVLFQDSGDPAVLSREQSISIYRMVQELMNNSLKHANAWHVWINLLWSEGQLKVIVKDDGIGLAAHHLEAQTRGMNTIKSNAMAIGALFHFKNVRKGTEFEMIFKLPSEAHKD